MEMHPTKGWAGHRGSSVDITEDWARHFRVAGSRCERMPLSRLATGTPEGHASSVMMQASAPRLSIVLKSVMAPVPNATRDTGWSGSPMIWMIG